MHEPKREIMQRYFEFVQFRNALNHRYELDDYELQLLRKIAQAHFESRLINITNLIRSGEIASQAIVHGKLQGLIRRGLVATGRSSVDRRCKLVGLTKMSLEYFGVLDKFIRWPA